MADEPKTVERELVCLGNVVLTGNRKGTEFRHINEDGSLGAPLFVTRKTVPGHVGSVYVLKWTPDLAEYYPKSGRYVRNWPDAEAVLAWRAKHEAIEIEERAVSKQKVGEAGAYDGAMQCLEPIRRQYVKTDRIGRLAIEVAVLDYLRAYRP